MYADRYNELMTEFPDSRNKIENLLLRDETFKEIAEDYLFCKRELEKLSATKSNNIIANYTEILKDLKEELLTRLKSN